MASQIPALPPFSVETDPRTVAHRWQKYVNSFEIYLNCLGKKTDLEKVNILLHISGSEVQDIFRTLTPADDKYDSALKALETYFNPTENIRYERSVFMSLEPKDNETVDMFVTRLKKQSSFCKYNELNSEDDFIVDLFINKCRSSELRRKLLETKKLDLKRLLEIARLFEQSQAQTKKIEETYQQGKVATQSNSINRVVQHKDNNKGAHPRKTNRQSHYSSKNENSNKVGNSNPGLVQKHRAPPNQNNTKNECGRCGHEGHHSGDKHKCPGYKTQCDYCGYTGHFARKCMKKLRKMAEKRNIHSTFAEENENAQHNTDLLDESSYSFQINSVYEKKRINCDLKINGVNVTMQLDSAADLTTIPENIANTLPNLVIDRKTKPLIRAYNEQPVEVIGVAKVDAQFDGQEVKQVPVVIVKKERKPLFGLDWINRFDPDWNKVMKYAKEVNTIREQNLLEEFHEIFEPGLGTVKNATASLELKEDAVPKFRPFLEPQLGLKSQIEQEILRLEREGNWQKVKYSQWATPLVPVAKADGGVRLCGNYKITVNPQLKVAQHPLPNPAVMFATMGGCQVFTKIDLKNAYQQLVMDEKSQEMCTLNTPLGLYRPKRLPYGVASGPALWQETMDKIFTGLPGVFIFVDDIVVAGKDEEEHESRLRKVLERMKENGLKINKSKCQFKVPSVEYLGFIIDEKGIHKTKEKIKAVTEAKVPTNVKELQSFLGLVTFYGRFIKDLATMAHPLYELLKKDVPWEWSTKCHEAFERIKKEITSDKFLVHYKPDLQIKLVCDASQVGIGCVLAHVMPDGTEKPIAFASRSLNKAEINYSQIEKEGLALVYGVKKFHMYLYGKKKFILVTDHKPLLAILGPKQGLPAIVAARLQRWAIILAAYNYELEYRPTSKMGNADALSRLPVDKAPEAHEYSVLLIEALNLPLQAKEIGQATKKDPILAKVKEYLMTNNETFLRSEECKVYKMIKEELSLERDCILRGARVVIPVPLRSRVMKEIHEGHQGIVKSKAIARSFVWWPGIDKDIETYVRNCEQCALHQNNPKPISLHPWEYARYPWQRLHIDFAGPFLGSSYLIVVDAYSKWPEVVPMHTTTSQNTVKSLMTLFSTHGLPERIVTDNGPQFCSEEFENFLKVNGIRHTLSAPYHPATNGEAERFVQTFKNAMKSYNATSANVGNYVSKFLLSYRTTPHTTTGVCPSLLLMGRRIRSKLDLMLPDSKSTNEDEMYRKLGELKKIRSFEVSDKVMVRTYGKNHQKWIPGIISKKLGTLNYEVQVNGNVLRKHIDQLQPGCQDTETPETSTQVESHESTNRVLPDRRSRGKPPDHLDL